MDQAIAKIRAETPAYAPAAYHFVRKSLDHALHGLKRVDSEGLTHVSGKELLEGFRTLALEEFGPLAKTVLAEWGITRCQQVGEVVFQLVQLGVLGKNENDTIHDFTELWSFTEAFDAPFQPQPLPAASGKSFPRRSSSSPVGSGRKRPNQATSSTPKE